jgi:hypothetical protein
MAAFLMLAVVLGVAGAGLAIGAIASAPGHGLRYMQLVYCVLLAAAAIRLLIKPVARFTTLLVVTMSIAGVGLNCWRAALAPGDWVSYFTAALLGLCLLALPAAWLIRRWVRARRA